MKNIVNLEKALFARYEQIKTRIASFTILSTDNPEKPQRVILCITKKGQKFPPEELIVIKKFFQTQIGENARLTISNLREENNCQHFCLVAENDNLSVLLAQLDQFILPSIA